MKRIFLAFAVCSTVISCKKSSVAPDACSVNTTTIAGTYSVTAIKYKSASNALETDQMASMENCQKDDTYELKTDGTVVISEAGNNCGLPPSPGTANSWSLNSSNTILVMGTNLNIVSFNCSQLVVEEKNLMVDGDVKTTTYEKL